MAGLKGPELEDQGLINSINITPFVDVVLVLLVIFMITAPMLVKEVLEIKLPKTQTGDGPVLKTLGVAVNREGLILLDGQLTDEGAFAKAIQAKTREFPELQAVISADVEVPYGKVVRVIDLLKSAGLNKFAVEIIREKATNSSTEKMNQ